MHASDKLMLYVLCETKDLQTNTYRQQLKIRLQNESWSACLSENAESYTRTATTLLDEQTGRYLIALARAIKPGEDIINRTSAQN